MRVPELLAAYAQLGPMVALLELSACPQPEPIDPEVCVGGLDEDGDGDTDCLDSDCAQRVDCRGAVVLPDAVGWRHMLAVPEEVWRVEPDWQVEWGGDLDGDGHADLGHVVAVEELPETDDHPAVGGGWVRVAPSSRLDGSPVDVADAPVSITNHVGGYLAQGTTTRCDVDGDGFDDLVAVDRHFSWYGHPPQDERVLTVAFGSPTLGADGPEGEAELLTVPLEAAVPESSYGEAVRCAGDIDGNGRDDLLLPTWRAGLGELVFVLDSDSLLHAERLLDAIRIAWVVELPSVRALGDIDGDGCDELYFQNPPAEGALMAQLGYWSPGFVLPGGPHLADPREVFSDPGEEERPPVPIELLAPEEVDATSSYGAPVMFGDLLDDEVPEIVVGQIDGRVEVHEAEGLGLLDGPIRLSPETLRMSVPWFAPDQDEREAPSMMGLNSIADLDGDGHDDLVIDVGVDLATVEFGGVETPEELAGLGVVVFFGGDLETSPERLWSDADLLIGLLLPMPGGWLAPDGDRDGDGLPELAFWSPPQTETMETPDTYAVGVLPGSALAAVR